MGCGEKKGQKCILYTFHECRKPPRCSIWNCEFCQKPRNPGALPGPPWGRGQPYISALGDPTLHHLGRCVACGQPDRESKEKKKKRIWLAVRAAGAVTDAAIYTIFTVGRTKSRRLPTTLRNSAFALLTRSANPRTGADRVPLHGHRASLF